MPVVTFFPGGRVATVPIGTSLLDAATLAGVTVTAPCGGEGMCGECRMRVKEGSVEHVPRGFLTPDELANGWALACGSRVTCDLTVDVPQEEVPSERRIVNGALRRVASGPEPRALARADVPPEPPTVKRLLQVDPPSLDNSFSDLDRLTFAIRRSNAPDNSPAGDNIPTGANITTGLDVLRKLAVALRDDKAMEHRRGKQLCVTATIVAGEEAGPAEIIRVEPGDTTGFQVGLAIDVGTTTCAVNLVDLVGNHILATAADYNGQLTRGSDIISRINYAKTPERVEELRRLVLETLNKLVENVCASSGISAEQIDNAAIAGNTTMVHLLLGLTAEFIRLEPYTPTVNHPPRLRASEVGIAMNPQAYVAFAPGVGSYVGGDISAGLLQTALADKSNVASGGDAVRLFLDIGTNGEVVIGTSEWLMTCAASAGPAFEGSGVGCGMRACTGAVERVRIDPDSAEAGVSVIGGGKPRGVCGSGMIDLLAQLWTTGLLDPSGKLDPSRSQGLIKPVDGSSRTLAYTIVTQSDSATGRAITINEHDIQNLLRTKAAVYSACAIMLKSVDLDFEAIVEVYVAGGFGRFLDLRHSIAIGLLPDLPLERYTYLGNASLSGARAMLCEKAARQRVVELAGRMTYLELNVDPAYMSEYTAALFLPHTDIDRFPTVKAMSVPDR